MNKTALALLNLKRVKKCLSIILVSKWRVLKKLTPGQKVQFVIVEGQKGPQAARVRAINETASTSTDD